MCLDKKLQKRGASHTPVTTKEVFDNLHEEIADMLVCCDVLPPSTRQRYATLSRRNPSADERRQARQAEREGCLNEQNSILRRKRK